MSLGFPCNAQGPLTSSEYEKHPDEEYLIALNQAYYDLPFWRVHWFRAASRMVAPRKRIGDETLVGFTTVAQGVKRPESGYERHAFYTRPGDRLAAHVPSEGMTPAEIVAPFDGLDGWRVNLYGGAFPKKLVVL